MHKWQLAILTERAAHGNSGCIVTLLKHERGRWLVEGEIEHPEGNVAHMLPDEVPYARAWVDAAWLQPINQNALIRRLLQQEAEQTPHP